MSDQAKAGLVSVLIQNLRPDVLRPEKFSKESRAFGDFSAVFRGIQTSHDRGLSAFPSGENEGLKEKRLRRAEEVGKEEVRKEESKKETEGTPLFREEAATVKMSSSRSDALENKAGDLKSSGKEGGKQRPASDVAGIPKNVIAGESVRKEGGLTIGDAVKVLSTEDTEKTATSEALKKTADVLPKVTEKNKALEAPPALQKAGMPPMIAGDEAGSEAARQTMIDFKAVSAKALQAQQGESQSAQTALENQALPAHLKPAVSSTSILQNVQALASAQSLVAEGGQQSGPGQGGDFSGNPALQHFSDFKSLEGRAGMEKVATDFRALLDAGRGIPDERAVLRQVAQELRAWRPGQHEPIRFLLEPKHLGLLQIDVILQEGVLRAHMVTADPLVKELLEGNQQFLQNALKGQGLQMQQFSVDLGDRKGFMPEGRSASVFKKGDPLSEEEADDFLAPPSSIIKPVRGALSLYI